MRESVKRNLLYAVIIALLGYNSTTSVHTFATGFTSLSTFAATAIVESESYDHNEYASTPAPTQRHIRVEPYLISFHETAVPSFLSRNRASGIGGTNHSTLSWFPASNGYSQDVLNAYADLTGFRRLNASRFDPKDPRSKDGYENSHHVGCFMSHWRLLKYAQAKWKAISSSSSSGPAKNNGNATASEEHLPDALLFLEDDASCLAGTMDRTVELLRELPSDWDLLYIGGKPFSYHNERGLSKQMLRDLAQKQGILQDWERDPEENKPDMHRLSLEEFRELVCRGDLGESYTGPFAPDGSRNLTLEQPYWRARYITNTQSYAINPKKIQRILDVIEHPNYQVPIDIAYADKIVSGHLKAYIPTRPLCEQGDISELTEYWEGYYTQSGLKNAFWDRLYHPECPSKL